MTIPSLSLESIVDLGIHLVPLAAMALGWRRLKKVHRDGAQLDRLSIVVFSILTITYLVLFLIDALSLNSEALSGKILFSKTGLRLVYLNFVIGAASGVSIAFRPSRVRLSFTTSAILVVAVCALDVARAVDVGI